MSNATSNATIGLAIDPSSLISSCELGSMGGSAAAQRYIELRTPVALVGPAAFSLPDIVAASVARSHAAAQMLAGVIAGSYFTFLLGVDVFGSPSEERRERALRTQLDVAREPVRRLVTVLMWTVLLALEAAQVLLCHLHPAAYIALGFSLVALLIQLCAVTFPAPPPQSSPSSETVEALLRQIAHGHRTALPLMLGVIAAEQWGSGSPCGAIGALTTLETLAEWQAAGASAAVVALENYENAELYTLIGIAGAPTLLAFLATLFWLRACRGGGGGGGGGGRRVTVDGRRQTLAKGVERSSTAPAAATSTTRTRGRRRTTRRSPTPPAALCRRPDAERAAAAGPAAGRRRHGAAAARPAAADERLLCAAAAAPPTRTRPTPPPSAAYNQYADPSLPPGWEAEVDPMTGQTFYTNVVTGQRLWERPVCENSAQFSSSVVFGFNGITHARACRAARESKGVQFTMLISSCQLNSMAGSLSAQRYIDRPRPEHRP